jgi:hypothetical protein
MGEKASYNASLDQESVARTDDGNATKRPKDKYWD